MTFGLGLLLSSVALADDQPMVIKAEEARQHSGKKVSVTFEVKHTKEAQKRNTVFLDSEEDFMNEKNLGIAITEAGRKELKEKQSIDSPADHFLKKTIQVIGTVEIREDRPYIDVSEAAQIKEVNPAG